MAEPVRLLGGPVRSAVLAGYAPYAEQVRGRGLRVEVVLVEPGPRDTGPLRLRKEASENSARAKVATFEALGYAARTRRLPADVSLAGFAACIDEADADPAVSGIIVQLPVPHRLMRQLRRIAPDKDLDHLSGAGPDTVCATADGIARMADAHLREGERTVVFGGRGFVGSGVVRRLEELGHATVVVDRDDDPRDADGCQSVVSTVGTAHWLTPGHLAHRRRHLLVDSGFTPDPRHGQDPRAPLARGDASPEAFAMFDLATPVPGGVGPVEMAVLAERCMVRDVGDHVPRWSLDDQGQVLWSTPPSGTTPSRTGPTGTGLSAVTFTGAPGAGRPTGAVPPPPAVPGDGPARRPGPSR